MSFSRDFKATLVVNPLDIDQVRENGIDLSIGDQLTIEPKAFALAKTREWVEFPIDWWVFVICEVRMQGKALSYHQQSSTLDSREN